jgi:hypothetical protein
MDYQPEFLCDEILEVVTGMQSLTLGYFKRLSLHALSGTSTIRLPGEHNNQFMLMPIDSRSISSFMYQAKVSRLGIILIPQPRSPVLVKVANGANMLCNSFILFLDDMEFPLNNVCNVRDMLGHDIRLGRDYLSSTLILLLVRLYILVREAQ